MVSRDLSHSGAFIRIFCYFSCRASIGSFRSRYQGLSMCCVLPGQVGALVSLNFDDSHEERSGLHTATSCPIYAWHLFVLAYSRERLIKARNWLEFALKPSSSPSIPPVCIMTCPSGNKWSASCTLLLIASWLDGNFFLSVLADFCHWNDSLLPQSVTVKICCLYVMPNKRTHHRRLACHSATAMSCVKVKEPAGSAVVPVALHFRSIYFQHFRVLSCCVRTVLTPNCTLQHLLNDQ